MSDACDDVRMDDPDGGSTFGAAARDEDATTTPVGDGFTARDGLRFATRLLPLFEQTGSRLSNAQVDEFIAAFYADDVCVVFDWIEWRDQGHVLLETSGAMERADLDDLRRLLTMLVRQDRFAEGTLAHAIEHGWIHAVLDRMRTICA